MGRPTIYSIMPNAQAPAKFLTRFSLLVRREYAALDKFRKMGYRVVEMYDGCTIKQFHSIISDPNTHGIFGLFHGSKNGIALDGENSTTQVLRPQNVTNRDANNKWPRDKGDIVISPNLQFFGFVGCKLTEDSIKDFAFQMGLKRHQVFNAKLDKNEETTDGQISDVLDNIYNYLITPKFIKHDHFEPIQAFVPYTTIPKVDIDAPYYMSHTVRYKDRVYYLADDYGYTDRKQFTEDVRRLNPGIDFSDLTPGQVINVPTKIKNPKLSTPYALRQVRQTSIIPDLSERIRILEDSDHDEQPEVPSQTHSAPTMPDLSDRIKILEDPDDSSEPQLLPVPQWMKDSFQDQPTAPQSQPASTAPDLSERIRILEDSGHDEQLQAPWQNRQTTRIPNLSDRIILHDDLDDGPNVPNQPQWMKHGVAGLPQVGAQLDFGPKQPFPNQPQWMKHGVAGLPQVGAQLDFGPQQPFPNQPQWMNQGFG